MRLQKQTGLARNLRIIACILAVSLVAQACTSRRVQVNPAVLQGNLQQQTTPVYPPEARQQGVQGDVVLEATIGKTGLIENLRVISGPELLRQAAYDAVKTWRYRPVMINGQATKVTTTITAHFGVR